LGHFLAQRWEKHRRRQRQRAAATRRIMRKSDVSLCYWKFDKPVLIKERVHLSLTRWKSSLKLAIGQTEAGTSIRDLGLEMVHLLRFALILSLFTFQSALIAPAKAEAITAKTICEELSSAAVANGVPVRFFTRLIWQESRFNPVALSRAGAQGIAQFMPTTADTVQLANPFDPPSAINKSAELLARLRTRFGNLGLAAAAYNAGPKRVADWLAGHSGLPQQTIEYVRTVTGHSVTEWRTARVELPLQAAPADQCPNAPDGVVHETRRQGAAANEERTPWGVQLVGDRSEIGALAAFHRMQVAYSRVLGSRKPLIIKSTAGRNAFWYRVRVGAASRQAANLLCSRLRQAGGSCLVQPN
jgi:hypothetical protein